MASLVAGVVRIIERLGRVGDEIQHHCDQHEWRDDNHRHDAANYQAHQHRRSGDIVTKLKHNGLPFLKSADQPTEREQDEKEGSGHAENAEHLTPRSRGWIVPIVIHPRPLAQAAGIANRGFSNA